MKIGMIGLGSMGMGAALNLVKHGHGCIGCELRARPVEAGNSPPAAGTP